MILAWLARLATSPIVATILVPAISDFLTKMLEKKAKATELRAACVSAKAAKKAEDFRAAAKKVGDATVRR